MECFVAVQHPMNQLSPPPITLVVSTLHGGCLLIGVLLVKPGGGRLHIAALFVATLLSCLYSASSLVFAMYVLSYPSLQSWSLGLRISTWFAVLILGPIPLWMLISASKNWGMFAVGTALGLALALSYVVY